MNCKRIIGLALMLTVVSWSMTVPAAQQKDLILADSSKKYQRLQPSNDSQGQRRSDSLRQGNSRRSTKYSSQQWRRSRSDRHDNTYYQKKGYRYDNRYRHNHYYPPLGLSFSLISRPHKHLYYRGSDYYFDVAGVWYTRSGVSFSVVMPPLGIVVPILPADYSTVWIDSAPHYYAGGVYYAWRPSVSGYVVVPAPDERRVVAQTNESDELFIYPKQDQSEEQQASDRYECHRWGADQSGFDPTQPAGGVAMTDYSVSEDNYQRAMRACLEGRGYSVR